MTDTEARAYLLDIALTKDWIRQEPSCGCWSVQIYDKRPHRETREAALDELLKTPHWAVWHARLTSPSPSGGAA